MTDYTPSIRAAAATDGRDDEAKIETVARIVCRAVDGDPDAMDAIDDSGKRIPMWRIFTSDAQEIIDALRRHGEE